MEEVLRSRPTTGVSFSSCATISSMLIASLIFYGILFSLFTRLKVPDSRCILGTIFVTCSLGVLAIEYFYFVNAATSSGELILARNTGDFLGSAASFSII